MGIDTQKQFRKCNRCAERKDSSDFQKVIDLRNTGVVIYRHSHVNQKTGLTQTAKSNQDVFILHNTKDVDISSADFIPEIEKNYVSCPKCRKILKKAKELLKMIPVVDKKDVSAVCDHCKKRAKSYRSCAKCTETIRKYVSIQNEHKDDIQKRFNTWLSRVKYLLKDVTPHNRVSNIKRRAQSETNINKTLEKTKYLQEEQKFQTRLQRSSSAEISSKVFATMTNIPYVHKHHKVQTSSRLASSCDNLQYNYSETVVKSKSKSIPGGNEVSHNRKKIFEYKEGYVKKRIEIVPESNTIDLISEIFDRIAVNEINQSKKNSRSGGITFKEEFKSPLIHNLQRHKNSQFSQEIFDSSTQKQLQSKKRDTLHIESPLIRSHLDRYPRDDYTDLEREYMQQNEVDEEKKSSIKKTKAQSEEYLSITKKGFETEFDFKFPKDHQDNLKPKHTISSSELIKKTQDILFARAEKERERKEELLRKKQIIAENKRNALEEKKEREKEQTSKKKVVEEEKLSIKVEKSEIEKEQKQKHELKKSAEVAKERSKQIKPKKADLKADKDAEKIRKEELKKNKLEIIQKEKEEKERVRKEKDAQLQKVKEQRMKDKEKEVAEKKRKKDEEKEKEKERLKKEKDIQVKTEKEQNLKNKDKEKLEKNLKGNEEKVVLKAKTEKPKEKEEKAKEMNVKSKEKGKYGQTADHVNKQLSEQSKPLENEKEDQEENERIAKETVERKIMENEILKKKKNKDSKPEKKPLEEVKELSNKLKNSVIEDKNIKINQIKVRKPSTDDLILELVRLKQSDPGKYREKTKELCENESEVCEMMKEHVKHQENTKTSSCLICVDSDFELDVERVLQQNYKQNIKSIIIGEKIFKYKPPFVEKKKDKLAIPTICDSILNCEIADTHKREIEKSMPYNLSEPLNTKLTGPPTKVFIGIEQESAKGIIRYALSDRTFIDKGWTMLPTEKVVRKINVYRMRPAHPEFDWFEHNKNKKLMLYDTGEKLAEFDDGGRGRWYYRNGNLALHYYDAEELNAQQRFVIYSSGEHDERGRSHPITILATFDYLGNGIVFDHDGKIRLKYNQTEGVLLDRAIGPVSHWKWHTLNDPPVLQQVMIDTQLAHKDPDIVKLGNPGDDKPRSDNEEMLAIEFDNFIKEKSKKLSQAFKPFQIKMKALKINEHFSLKVLDQATVYLIFRDGSTNLKLNIGMILDHKEIVDTDTADVGDVSNNLERFPARTDSLAKLQRSVAYAQRFERTRTERDRRLRPPEPCNSADNLTAALSKPLRPPLRTVPSSSIMTRRDFLCKCSRKPSGSNLYYDTRFI